MTSSATSDVIKWRLYSGVAASEHEVTEMSVYVYFLSFSSFRFAVVFVFSN